MVTSIDAATGTVTEKPNPRWWGTKPKLSSIVWRIAAPEIQAKAYAADELDAINVDATTYASARKHGMIQKAAGTEWSQLTLNGARGPLKDANVRRAVAHAIDRNKIADTVAGAFGSTACRSAASSTCPANAAMSTRRPASRTTPLRPSDCSPRPVTRQTPTA